MATTIFIDMRDREGNRLVIDGSLDLLRDLGGVLFGDNVPPLTVRPIAGDLVVHDAGDFSGILSSEAFRRQRNVHIDAWRARTRKVHLWLAPLMLPYRVMNSLSRSVLYDAELPPLTEFCKFLLVYKGLRALRNIGKVAEEEIRQKARAYLAEGSQDE